MNTLQLEFLFDQLIQINAACDHVASCESRRAGLNLQCAAKFIENFQRKKRDLTFVIVLKIEIPITVDTAPRQAFNFGYFNHRMRVRFAPMMANKIVSRGNEQMANFHRTHATIEAPQFT